MTLNVVEGADRTPPSQANELYSQSARRTEGKAGGLAEAEGRTARGSLISSCAKRVLAEIEISELMEEAEDSLAK